ncbi:cysteine--tRNA ligase [Sodalis-like secondary symbiont of Drepanosiphum platanoidis]|uniref:cysteine--tRNA ligase n=1 Tax=Sodalis-like secondary symbiont of Drepanosiphum platanoidis TaxID=2994493 RepID=UPI003463B371
MLKIFNTLTKKKEKFKSIYSKIVNIYVCGVTVYDLCHIGHGRTFVIFDMIVRYFNYIGYKVNYIRNITDIEDKIIIQSNKLKKNIYQLTNDMIYEMHKDFDKLNILRPTFEPRATNNIKYIIKIIKILLKNKKAYIAPDGNVFFSVSSQKNYGNLSKQNIFKLKEGIRIKKNFNKKNFKDFILWKLSPLQEPSWDSPWGNGRPGWHIECSSINYKYFNSHCDIHGGGSDLIFPHHENEIAQSFSIKNKSCVNFWIHSGTIINNNKKMSKSLGNFLYLRNIMKKYHPEVIRYFFMSSHYRNNISYKENELIKSQNSLKKLYTVLNNTNTNIKPFGGDIFIKEFNKSMNNDFNTPQAYCVLFKLVKKINYMKKKESKLINGLSSTLKYLGQILGIFKENPKNFLKNFTKKNNKYIIKLIKQRNIAREKCQWDISDKLRKKLLSMGIFIKDKSYKKNI